jgi:phosphoglycolate phosphatase
MENLPLARLLVLDLDNTLWDWHKIWFESFGKLIESISERTGISLNQLLDEAQVAHREAHTSDFELVLDYLPSLVDYSSPKKPREFFAEEMHRYYSTRKRLTVLYPDTMKALARVKARGAKIVAFTESDSYLATQRLIRTGLDGVIETVWVAPDLAVTDDAKRKELRTRPDEEYKLQATLTHTLPPGLRKPAPEVLQQICAGEGVRPWEAVYVGDSLSRDVAMADSAGLIAAYAKYGDTVSEPSLKLLQRVSHWSEKEIVADALARENKPARVEVELANSLLELFEYCNFYPPRARSADSDGDRLKSLIELWKQTVDVQKSFNTISWQIRGLGISAITAAYAGAGLAHARDVTVTAFKVDLAAAGAILSLGLLLWWGLWYMERSWYHKLLVGAGNQAQHLEREMRDILEDPRVGLSHDITDASHNRPWIFRRALRLRRVSRPGSTSKRSLRWVPRTTKARNRLNRFYGWVTCIIVGSMVAFWWVPIKDFLASLI